MHLGNPDSSNFFFIISGPSGVGKTTLSKLLCEKFENLKLSISCTTRLPREGEVDGSNYFFKTDQQFDEMIKNNKLMEYAEVFGKRYGTPLDFIDNNIKNSINVLFDVDSQGKKSVEKFKEYNYFSLFIMPPSIEELSDRLVKRGDLACLESRKNSFFKGLEDFSHYDFLIINKNLEQTFYEIQSIYISMINYFSKFNKIKDL